MSRDLQGWRIEIKKFPRLTEFGAWRGPPGKQYGGFYTQEQVHCISLSHASVNVAVCVVACSMSLMPIMNVTIGYAACFGLRDSWHTPGQNW